MRGSCQGRAAGPALPEGASGFWEGDRPNGWPSLVPSVEERSSRGDRTARSLEKPEKLRPEELSLEQAVDIDRQIAFGMLWPLASFPNKVLLAPSHTPFVPVLRQLLGPLQSKFTKPK